MGAHKWALVAAFVFGAAGIVGLKYDEETPFRAAFWSIAVILLYAAAAWAIRRAGRRSARRLDPEAAGDNCYYLGFVFTLVSLAVTLWRLSPETGGALNDETFPQLISGFGVALSSTIVGIVLRVLHVRMEAEPETLARDARDGLAAAVDEFRDNLLSANRLLNGFAVETAQLLSEQRADMRKLAAETEASHRRALTESVDAHMNALRDALGAATERAVAAIADGVIEVTRAAHDELARRVAELGRRETETLGSLVDGVSRFSGELTRFEAAMGALAASLESVGAGVSKRFDPAAGAFEAGMARAAERFAESGHTDRALRRLMEFSSSVNGYFQRCEPWKGGPGAATCAYVAVNSVRSLAVCSSPFIPHSARAFWAQLGLPGTAEAPWDSAGAFAVEPGHRLGRVEPVFEPVGPR